MKTKLVLAFSIAVCVHMVATAQNLYTLDQSYGKNGVAVEALPTNWLAESMIAWKAFDDGSAYIVRRGPVDDTMGIVVALQRNGMTSPFFNEDGISPVGIGFTYLSNVLFIEDAIYLGAMRGRRYELIAMDNKGSFRQIPFFQDIEQSNGTTPLGISGDNRLWLISSIGDTTARQYLRYLSNFYYPSSEITSVLLDNEPVNYYRSGLFEGRSFVDNNNQLLLSSHRGYNSVVISKFLPDGSYDEEFGNALGTLVLPLPFGDELYGVYHTIIQLRDGGYLVTVPIKPKNTIDSKKTLMYKLTTNGGLDPLFGVNGLIEIHGNQMENRGVIELPSGLIMYLSFGTYGYSHQYIIRQDGSLVPGEYGDFSVTPIIGVGQVIANKWLYGEVNNGFGEFTIARFILGPGATDVTENEPASESDIVLRNDWLHVSDIGQHSIVSFYSTIGQLITSIDIEPGASGTGSVKIPQSVPKGPVVVVVSTHSGSISALKYY